MISPKNESINTKIYKNLAEVGVTPNTNSDEGMSISSRKKHTSTNE